MQLYIKGEFIGGCDITTQLHAEGRGDQCGASDQPQPSPPLMASPSRRACQDAQVDRQGNDASQVRRLALAGLSDVRVEFARNKAKLVLKPRSGITERLRRVHSHGLNTYKDVIV